MLKNMNKGALMRLAHQTDNLYLAGAAQDELHRREVQTRRANRHTVNPTALRRRLIQCGLLVPADEVSA